MRQGNLVRVQAEYWEMLPSQWKWLGHGVKYKQAVHSLLEAQRTDKPSYKLLSSWEGEDNSSKGLSAGQFQIGVCLESVQVQAAKYCSAHWAEGNICLHKHSPSPCLLETRQALTYADLFLYFQGNTAAWWLLLELLRWSEGRCEHQEEAAGRRRGFRQWMQPQHGGRCKGCSSLRDLGNTRKNHILGMLNVGRGFIAALQKSQIIQGV